MQGSTAKNREIRAMPASTHAGMRTADFDFILPDDLIAQLPLARRDASRLLVLDRASAAMAHRQFSDLLDYLQAGDVLVLNNSRVIPARLRGTNARTGGEFEILLLTENARNDWWCLLRPGKRARVGTQIIFRRHHDPSPKGPVLHIETTTDESAHLCAYVTEVNDEGHRRLRFECPGDVRRLLDDFGEVPLPPYIRRESPNQVEGDRNRYQTVYAQAAGSVAAPTAGLHFTEDLLDSVRARGVQVYFVTLHVGLGTFAPVKADDLAEHRMHEESFEVPPETARALNEAKASGRRVIAVGTTTLRVLESSAAEGAASSSPGQIRACSGSTNIFIYPPFGFRIVDVLLTNFHLPRSTLLMLVSAFAAPEETRGCELILEAYREAICQRYRFFSYGDAMLIL
jgi:S-adenosylmethionine:tRNA ribosyltransferase-isomerase